MKGEVESEWKVASNLTYLRRQMSVCGVRSVADSLLCRLQQAGPAGRGAAAAARRHSEGESLREGGQRDSEEICILKMVTSGGAWQAVW